MKKVAFSKATFFLAGDRGFEPLPTDPESVVLPLDQSPITDKSLSH